METTHLQNFLSINFHCSIFLLLNFFRMFNAANILAKKTPLLLSTAVPYV